MKIVDAFRVPKGLSTPDRIQAVLSVLIKISLVLAAAIALLEADWTTTFVSLATLAVILLPWYLSKDYGLRLPVGFEFVIVLFIYATLFLGEVHGFYTRFWWWDVVLHTGAGTAFGFIGFLILYYFYREGKFQAPPYLIALFSFAVSMAIGAIWEIFEFAMDQVFGLNMQKSGLTDTMWDLIVNMVGALVAALSGFLYLQYRTRGLGLFRYYINSYFSAEGRKRRRPRRLARKDGIS